MSKKDASVEKKAVAAALNQGAATEEVAKEKAGKREGGGGVTYATFADRETLLGELGWGDKVKEGKRSYGRTGTHPPKTTPTTSTRRCGQDGGGLGLWRRAALKESQKLWDLLGNLNRRVGVSSKGRGGLI